MTIEFRCTHCQKLLRTSDDKAGLQAACPGCGNTIDVPAPEFADEQRQGGDDWQYRETVIDGESAAGASKTCPMCGEQVQAAAIKCRHCGEDLSGTVPAGRRQIVYAGFWLRFVAFIIDMVIVGLPVFIAVLVVGLLGGILEEADFAAGNDQFDALERTISNFAFVVLTWPYYALMESSSRQATVGKMAVGIIVTDDQGRRISFGRATGRHFGKLLSELCCALGYIMAAFTDRKQALHDLLAQCLVVRK